MICAIPVFIAVINKQRLLTTSFSGKKQTFHKMTVFIARIRFLIGVYFMGLSKYYKIL